MKTILRKILYIFIPIYFKSAIATEFCFVAPNDVLNQNYTTKPQDCSFMTDSQEIWGCPECTFNYECNLGFAMERNIEVQRYKCNEPPLWSDNEGAPVQFLPTCTLSDTVELCRQQKIPCLWNLVVDSDSVNVAFADTSTESTEADGVTSFRGCKDDKVKLVCQDDTLTLHFGFEGTDGTLYNQDTMEPISVYTCDTSGNMSLFKNDVKEFLPVRSTIHGKYAAACQISMSTTTTTTEAPTTNTAETTSMADGVTTTMANAGSITTTPPDPSATTVPADSSATTAETNTANTDPSADPDTSGGTTADSADVTTGDGSTGDVTTASSPSTGRYYADDGSIMDENDNVIAPEGSTLHSNGSVTGPGGSILPEEDTGLGIADDGSIINLETDEVIAPPGSTVTADGHVVSPSGTVLEITDSGLSINADGEIVNADGNVIAPSGSTLNANGTISGPGGTQLLNYDSGLGISDDGSIINLETGEVIAPPGSTVTIDGHVVGPTGTVLEVSDLELSINANGEIVDANGNVIAPSGSTLNADGSLSGPSGSELLGPDTGLAIAGDGSIIIIDSDTGEAIAPAGSTVTAEGFVVSSHGTVLKNTDLGLSISSNGNVVDADGNIVAPPGSVVNEDGSITLPGGTVLSSATALPEGYTIASDGSILDSMNNVVGSPGVIIQSDGSMVKNGVVVATAPPPPQPVLVDLETGTQILPDGKIIDQYGNVIAPAGSYVGTDGAIYAPDDSIAIASSKESNVEIDIGYIEGPYIVSSAGRLLDPSITNTDQNGIVTDGRGRIVYIPDVAVNLPAGATFTAEGIVSNGVILVESPYTIRDDGAIMDKLGIVAIPASEDANVLLPLGAIGNIYGFVTSDGTNIVAPGSYVDEHGVLRNVFGNVIKPSVTGVPTTTEPPTEYPPIQYEEDNRYAATSYIHIGDIEEETQSVQGIEYKYESVTAPFGFGNAVKLPEEQGCKITESFGTKTSGFCFHPKDCTTGISMSVWTKFVLPTDVYTEFNSLNESDTKCLISTGGDENGHPGVSVCVNKIMLRTIVSTGTQFWYSNIAAPIINNTWTNVGFRWSTLSGLMVYFNTTIIGSTKYSNTSTEKPILSPPRLMLGCHRTSSSMMYDNYYGSYLDEYAYWRKRLPDDELIYFMGGYTNDSAKVDIINIIQKLENVDLNDPVQFDQTIKAVLKSSTDLEVEAAATATTNVTESTPTGATGTTAAPLTSGLANSLTNFERVFVAMTKTKDVTPGSDTTAMCTKFNIVYLMNTLLADNTAATWKQIQSSGVRRGSEKIVSQFQKWSTTVLESTKLQRTEPFQICTKASPNVVFQSYKEKLTNLKKRTQTFKMPDVGKGDISDFENNFDFAADNLEIRVNMFNDPRCNNRILSAYCTFLDDYDEMAPLEVNKNYLKPGVNKIDSRVLLANVGIDPVYTADGDKDPNYPLCIADPNFLKDQGIKFTLTHNYKKISDRVRRKLLFHSNEITTEVKARQCVWWNEKIGTHGGWDAANCTMLETTATHSVCTCQHFGTYAILAEYIVPPTVFEEPTWLASVKYILYIVSCVCLGLYSFIVLISGDLKEQFHMLGMNLSLTCIGGILSMMFSDVIEIRTNRHSCVIFGFLMHFFFSIQGFLIVCLGHACFKAITKGVIRGMLKCYLMISWGLTLVCVGIPLVAFMRDLGTDLRCFIAFNPYLKLIFFVPHLICVCVILFTAIVILCNLHRTALRKKNLIQDYGSFAFGAAILFIYFGVTWIFGYFAYVHLPFEIPFFYVLFQVCHACMGIIIFVTIGLFSKKYLRIFKSQAKEKQDQMRQTMDKMQKATESQKGKKSKSKSKIKNEKETKKKKVGKAKKK